VHAAAFEPGIKPDLCPCVFFRPSSRGCHYLPIPSFLDSLLGACPCVFLGGRGVPNLLRPRRHLYRPRSALELRPREMSLGLITRQQVVMGLGGMFQVPGGAGT